MTEFFTDYPYLKWILIGFGVLALLAKYLKFDPIDKLIDRKNKYKFEETNHLENPKLKALIDLLKEQKWSELTERFQSFGASYRSFGLRTLGQYGNDNALNNWLKQEPNADLPNLIKAHRLVFQAWEYRGRGTIDTVSEKNLKQYKDCLREAQKVLLSIDKNSDFAVNRNSLLLKTYKALDPEREIIHSTYQEVLVGNENNAELNFNYFSAISPKWGGTQEELDTYLNSLERKSEFINNLIGAQYYFDHVHMMNGNDPEKKIKGFIEEMKTFSIEDDELYRYELYLLLYWISNNLEYLSLEKHYQQLVKPFWKD